MIVFRTGRFREQITGPAFLFAIGPTPTNPMGAKNAGSTSKSTPRVPRILSIPGSNVERNRAIPRNFCRRILAASGTIDQRYSLIMFSSISWRPDSFGLSLSLPRTYCSSDSNVALPDSISAPTPESKLR